MAPRRWSWAEARRCHDWLSKLDSERELPAESAAYGQGVRLVLAVELARWG
jgi:hypothetical protein